VAGYRDNYSGHKLAIGPLIRILPDVTVPMVTTGFLDWQPRRLNSKSVFLLNAALNGLPGMDL